MSDYTYAIVQISLPNFPNNGIVIVTVDHLVFTMDRTSYVRYLIPPFSEDNLQFIDEMIKTAAKVPEDWPLLECGILKYCSKSIACFA